MFAVKLANFLVFTASEEVTVKCLVGSSDILANEWSDLFVSLRKSSEIIQNCRKMAELYWPFWSRFCFFLVKIYCFKDFFTVSVKMPKI